MLEVRDLTKRYGDITAIEGVNLTVNQGELFTLVGPSGSGKSTLLRCIAGLESPSSGRISIGGRDVTNLPAFRRDTAMVFQNLALFPHMSVSENIAYGLKRQGIQKEEREATIQENLQLVDLAGYEDRSVREISGGEQQRVALARSIAVQPELLLLDEPLGSLDQKLRVQLQNDLYELQRELGQTMIYVTHDQNVALSISDRVAVINDAKVEQVGTPSELYEDPETLFVAEFIGESTTIGGKVVRVDEPNVEMTVDGSNHTLVGKGIGGTFKSGNAVQGVIKSEDIVMGENSGAMNTFTCEVRQISYQGTNSKVRVKVDGDLSVVVTTTKAESYDIGETVSISWNEEDFRVYEDGTVRQTAKEVSG